MWVQIPDDQMRNPKVDYGKIESRGHFHEDSRGMLHKCFHQCRSALSSWQFWLGMTLGFPLEHWLWEKAPGFRHITELMGL